MADEQTSTLLQLVKVTSEPGIWLDPTTRQRYLTRGVAATRTGLSIDSLRSHNGLLGVLLEPIDRGSTHKPRFVYTERSISEYVAGQRSEDRIDSQRFDGASVQQLLDEMNEENQALRRRISEMELAISSYESAITRLNEVIRNLFTAGEEIERARTSMQSTKSSEER
jgi:hypothetical protein